MPDQQKLVILLGLIVSLCILVIWRKKDTKNSFLYGISLSVLAYSLSSFLFFWFAVYRRMAVLNISLKFDSDVAFAMILIPMAVAVPWLPLGIITGVISLKKGNKMGLRFFYIFLAVITIALSILFWNLPYN